MVKTTKAESEATAERIRCTAAELFATHGFAGIGLEQIAAAADVTRGAVYHHFSGKRELFEVVANRAQQRVADAVVESAATEPDPWAGLLAGCRAFLIASLSEPHRRILLIDAPSVLGWSTWRSQDAGASGRQLNDAVQELADAEVISVHSPSGMAVLLSGAMNEAALHIAEAENPSATLEAVWVDLERLLAGLRTPPGSPSTSAATSKPALTT